jgi:hypothetical protein
MKVINPKKRRRPVDETDRESIAYKTGFASGQEHQHSSPDTLIALKKMGDDINNLKISSAEDRIILKNIEKLLTNHIDEEDSYRLKQDAFHKDMYEKKADKKEVEDLKEIIDSKTGKWAGNILIWGGGVVGVAILGAVMELILRK